MSIQKSIYVLCTIYLEGSKSTRYIGENMTRCNHMTSAVAVSRRVLIGKSASQKQGTRRGDVQSIYLSFTYLYLFSTGGVKMLQALELLSASGSC